MKIPQHIEFSENIIAIGKTIKIHKKDELLQEICYSGEIVINIGDYGETRFENGEFFSESGLNINVLKVDNDLKLKIVGQINDNYDQYFQVDLVKIKDLGLTITIDGQIQMLNTDNHYNNFYFVNLRDSLYCFKNFISDFIYYKKWVRLDLTSLKKGERVIISKGTIFYGTEDEFMIKEIIE